jgi:hypothetical protein
MGQQKNKDKDEEDKESTMGKKKSLDDDYEPSKKQKTYHTPGIRRAFGPKPPPYSKPKPQSFGIRRSLDDTYEPSKKRKTFHTPGIRRPFGPKPYSRPTPSRPTPRSNRPFSYHFGDIPPTQGPRVMRTRDTDNPSRIMSGGIYPQSKTKKGVIRV